MVVDLIAAAAILFAPTAMAAAQPVESAITAPGPQGPLAGTMLMPAGGKAAPVVLMIPGSGPTDRDGNNPMGGKAASLKLLAEGLAGQGIGSVRIDKRGLFGSATAIADANKVTIGDYAGDVHRWVAAIRQQTGAACVWVLGHSEGGLVALTAAQQPAGICGLILVATPGRPLGEVMRAQIHANPANAPIQDQADAAITALEAGKPVDPATLHPALAPLFRPEVQAYEIDLFSHDPAKLIAAYRGPVLIVQGSRDLQVSPDADARALAAADPRATLAMVAGANHVLKAVASDDRAVNLATYADPALPLAPGVVQPIVDFVHHHAAR
jgi:pimeloyl-ACP methyl ester carboxylesterase